jgi:hypothetical protein
MQECVTGGEKGCETLGGGMLDHRGETTHHEVSRIKNDKLVFVVGVLHGICQCIFRRQRKLILALNQSMVSLRPGSGSPRSMASLRQELSWVRASRMHVELIREGAMRNVEKVQRWPWRSEVTGYKCSVRYSLRIKGGNSYAKSGWKGDTGSTPPDTLTG